MGQAHLQLGGDLYFSYQPAVTHGHSCTLFFLHHAHPWQEGILETDFLFNSRVLLPGLVLG